MVNASLCTMFIRMYRYVCLYGFYSHGFVVCSFFLLASANYGNLHIDLIFKLQEKIARMSHALLGKQAIDQLN